MNIVHDPSNSTGSELVDQFGQTLQHAQNREYSKQFAKTKAIQAKKESFEHEFGEAPQGVRYALDDNMQKLNTMKTRSSF